LLFLLEDFKQALRDYTQENIDRFSPIVAFSGLYDGAGHAIRGLWVDKPRTDLISIARYQGLFGRVEGGTLSNIRIESGLLKGYRYDDIAGVVGHGDSNTTITNCSNNATVVGGYYHTGGVVGFLKGNITGSYNTGAISGTFGYGSIGGVLGKLDGGNMTGCYNSGIVNGDQVTAAGGVLGELNAGEINACHNTDTGVVTGRGHVGGVVGQCNKYIEGCYNTGTVNGISNVGGVGGNGIISRFLRIAIIGAQRKKKTGKKSRIKNAAKASRFVPSVHPSASSGSTPCRIVAR
jgi:hypothetical protein